MCFYLALKVYILYSFFCTTFSPPGRTGSGCPLGRRADGFGTELGKRRWLQALASRFPIHVEDDGGMATGAEKLSLPS